MKKIILIIFLFLLTNIPIFAFQDCVVIGEGRLTNISIEHNDIIDVYPMFTIMNEKNTLFVQPLKVGKTKFSVLKNKKEKYVFDVDVSETETKISDVKGFDVFVLDEPEKVESVDEYLDLPPGLGGM